jgi:glycosyltransferase involved in cell wall biosynthesis
MDFHGNASVSVIVPTFNVGSELDRTIVSLHQQTLRPVEIIVVDDCSTDETRAVAEPSPESETRFSCCLATGTFPEGSRKFCDFRRVRREAAAFRE